MTSRGLKIALIVSVAVNIFAVASGTALWVSRQQVIEQVGKSKQPGRKESISELVTKVEPQTRERVMAALRDRAMVARPDFEAARQARREAIRLTQEDEFKPVEVAALLARSREAELKGRAQLEASAVDILSGLSAQDRKTLAPILSRHHPRSKFKKCPQPERHHEHGTDEVKSVAPASARVEP